MLVFALVIGVVIGFLFACLGMTSLIIGDLRVDKSDPDDTYLFLELAKDPGDIINRKYVVLKVNPKSYISQD